jgi:threonine dehydratase
MGVLLADVEAARGRISSHVRHTPLRRSPLLSRKTGQDVWLKLESLQETGSFKPRGAFNKLLCLGPRAWSGGIVAASAGNHALGVAHAVAVLGIKECDLFVQENASPVKLAKLREQAVRLHCVGTSFEAAQQAALAHVRKSGASFVSAYDDFDVVAGHGTCGMEILEDLATFDAVVVPVGGGALSAGIAVAIKAVRPAARVWGVNPAASPSALLSFQGNAALDPYDHEPTLAHGLAGGYGRVPYSVARRLIDAVVLVSESEIRNAMAALIDSDQVLAEASGSVGVAALVSGKLPKVAGRIVIVVSGGNVDVATLREVLH